ncbi:hypothetical protein SAMN05216228_1015112 [Rhizobium tibeticum]|uniref:Uncharacterized protein n=1 Tax=Rhizobium tibeticum TaxID=501024 RepID=A0A1H8NWB9_9HYPH|nr:hypothetical protein RTCCBAU85039_3596 [Rhizobium tibeticum]SEO33949.1 hypothetical protein SAMN05216228_1015112 [Rhizobium tibeticum]
MSPVARFIGRPCPCGFLKGMLPSQATSLQGDVRHGVRLKPLPIDRCEVLICLARSGARVGRAKTLRILLLVYDAALSRASGRHGTTPYFQIPVLAHMQAVQPDARTPSTQLRGEAPGPHEPREAKRTQPLPQGRHAAAAARWCSRCTSHMPAHLAYAPEPSCTLTAHVL